MQLSDGAPYAAIGEGEDAELIVGATNLYLEMGGQVSDTGTIRAADGSFVFEVKDVRRPLNGLILHSGTVVSGTVEAGKAAVVEIDLERRRDIQANHTATHLLHAALHRVIGDQARQAGSLVAPDRLRFDFNSNRALTAEELSEIERIVNQDILAGYPVMTTIENLDDAMNEGVMAIFNEKYGDRVRVLRILDGETPVSAELCGGTHVSNTAEIGPFILLSEGSVATGIRRIEAITRRAAIEFIQVSPEYREYMKSGPFAAITGHRMTDADIDRMRDQDKSPGSAVCEDCIHMFADISAVPNGSSDPKYYERDNMGTRQDNMGQATSYWMIERMQSAVKPQFTLFTMPSYAAGEKAFLSLPFFHKAEDSGKLICDRLMTFGLYEVKSDNKTTGKFEAMISGTDLTLDEFNQAESAFKENGGKRKNSSAPETTDRKSVV